MTNTTKRAELSNPLTNLMLATGKIKATNYPDIIEQGSNFIDAHSKAYTEIMAWHEQEIAEAVQTELKMARDMENPREWISTRLAQLEGE